MEPADTVIELGTQPKQLSSLRLLVLSPVNLGALCHGTGLRAYHLIRGLEKSCCITVLSSESFSTSVEIPRHRLRALLDFSQPYPFQPEFQDAVQKAIASDSFDAIIVFGAELLQYLKKCTLPIIADLVDEPVLATLRELRTQAGVKRLRTIKNALSLVGYQRRFCRNIKACMGVSEEGARSFNRIVPGIDFIVVPNGVDTDLFCPSGLSVQEGRIVFSGNMSFPPNVAGCLYFARHVFPRIRAEFPSAHWMIVGRDPAAEVQALQKIEGIVVVGSVPTMNLYLEQAAVVVSPLISGGGIKNKILEAWAMHKGVVTTRLGAAGLEFSDGVNLLVAKNARSFADKVVFLLQNSGVASALGEAGYRTVTQMYKWEDKSAKLESVVQSAVANARKSS